MFINMNVITNAMHKDWDGFSLMNLILASSYQLLILGKDCLQNRLLLLFMMYIAAVKSGIACIKPIKRITEFLGKILNNTNEDFLSVQN